ncbi:MAG TPA: Amuc_1100 family pilus-like protein [Chthoniobacterales bacterium]|jgi:hypothetical protein
MNWFTENKVFSSFLVVIALAALALGYLTFSESGRKSEAVAAYDASMEKLTRLRGLAPYRNVENLQKIKDQVANYRGLTDSLHAELIKGQGEIIEIEPSAFQVRLRDSVSKTVEKASQRGVELPPKFYLGFEKYESELPRNDITGLLSWQLTAVETVVNRLIDLKVTKIEPVLRPLLPGEANPEAPSKQASLLQKYPFQVVFQGTPGNLQSILNELASSPQFTITRALRVENEQLQGPPQGVAAPAGDPSAPAQPAVDRIIIGKEKITANVVVDLVQFTPKATPKK